MSNEEVKNNNQEVEEGREKPARKPIGDISWVIKEYEEHEHTRVWYIAAGLVGVLLLVYSFRTDNILFSFITILGAFLLYMKKTNPPRDMEVLIDGEGVHVGGSFYDYDDIRDFVIIYKPKLEVKNIYLEFKSILKHRVTIPLENMNPLPIREKLLRYIPENAERINPPFSEGIARILRL